MKISPEDNMPPTTETAGPNAVHAMQQTNGMCAARGTVRVSPAQFRAIWCLAMLYHGFNAVFIFGVGAVQVLISDPAVYVNVWLIDIPPRILFMAGWTYLAVAGLHLVVIAQHVWQSLCRRRLSFGYDQANHPTPTMILTGPQAVVSKSRYSPRIVAHGVAETCHKYFGMHGEFGVHGARFYTAFFCRQLFEIVLQTYQAYQASGSITSPTINRFIVSLIVVNCLYTPLIERFTSEKDAIRRATCLMIDLLLDFTMCVVVPIVICIPHALEFDWKIFAYPDDKVYNEVWLTNTITEVRYIMVSSHLDYLSSILLLLAALLDIRTLKMIFQRLDYDHRVSTGNTKPSDDAKVSLLVSRQSWRLKLLQGLVTTAWAAFVGFNHFASQKAPIEQCSLHVNAWFATNVSCSIAQLNCLRLNTTGQSQAIEQVLERFERPMLTKLVLSHCAALEVSLVLREFEGLTGFEMFNVTIASWPPTAAITAYTHPLIKQVQLIDTNFSAFPNNLLRPDLPTRTHLVIFGGNLTSLPPSIGSAWANRIWPMIRIEHTQLTTLPETFHNLRVEQLSLAGNQIVRLDGDVFARQRFTSLRISNNPLTTVPSTIGDASVLSRLLLENTSVTTAPKWLLDWRRDRRANSVVSFVGSPLCQTEEELTKSGACVDELSSARRDDFRYDLISQQRPQ